MRMSGWVKSHYRNYAVIFFMGAALALRFPMYRIQALGSFNYIFCIVPVASTTIVVSATFPHLSRICIGVALLKAWDFFEKATKRPYYKIFKRGWNKKKERRPLDLLPFRPSHLIPHHHHTHPLFVVLTLSLY